jgi:hypothetical protein
VNLGVHRPEASLGLLINENKNELATLPWLFWFPFVFIVLISLSVNFIGDGLRDAFDPRGRQPALGMAAGGAGKGKPAGWVKRSQKRVRT